MRWLVVVAAALLVSACLSDPVGPQGLRLVVLDGQDSAWVGRPGDDTIVRVRVVNELGEPAPGIRLQWVPTGTGGTVTAAAVVSGRDGYATAEWRIGTDAADRQELRVTARGTRSMDEVVIRGRVVPSVVAALRAKHDLPLVVRLGDTLSLEVVAVDAFGNEFAAPTLAWAVLDSTLGTVVNAALVAGQRRGQSALRVTSGEVVAAFPLHVVQRIAAIEPLVDTLRFTSLRAEARPAYVVRDDRGQAIADTVALFAIEDTAVAHVVDGQVRAVGVGATRVRLSLGNAVTHVAIDVRQRIASLRLVRDTVHFDALQDTTTLRPVAFDSLGSEVRDPQLVYEVSGDSVAKVAGGSTIAAVNPGVAVVTARDPVTGVTTSVEIVVRQRVARIDLPVAPIQFDALADALIVIATARDRLGSLIAGAALEFAVVDSAVARFEAGGNRLLAVGPGQTTLTVRDGESGVEVTKVVQVQPVATSLTVAVAFGNPVVTLPAGAPLPLTCAATDRNGFAVAQVPTLVRAARGTVSGAGCADARVARSGYDTLHFALGTASVSVPVIVATRPDSVGMVAAAQPLTDDQSIRFVGEDLAHPSIVALRPLVQEILAAYGNPTTNLDRARAIRDWVARTAVHPSEFLHPNGSAINTSVLPSGKTWADVNAAAQAQWDADLAYWMYLSADGTVMLDRLLGTLDRTTGVRADDGMMVHVGGAHYRMRSVDSYHYLLCSFQSVLATTLWAAAGLHGLILQTLGHDPAAVFIPELGRWVYEDPTFNEEYLLDGAGDPLSPADLLALGTAGTPSRARATKGAGPSYDRLPYVPDESYQKTHGDGFVIMGSRLYRLNRPNPTLWDGRFGQIDVAALTGTPFDDPIRVTPEQAFPMLGVVVEDVAVEDSVFVVRLASTYPNHQRFERRVQGGDWEAAEAIDVLPVGACRVEYRNVDGIGNISATTVLDVWVPRTAAFLQGGSPSGMRRQSRFCA